MNRSKRLTHAFLYTGIFGQHDPGLNTGILYTGIFGQHDPGLNTPEENQFGIYVYIMMIKARDTTSNEIQWNLYT
jgi:hypothetical protein